MGPKSSQFIFLFYIEIIISLGKFEILQLRFVTLWGQALRYARMLFRTLPQTFVKISTKPCGQGRPRGKPSKPIGLGNPPPP